MPRPGYGPTPPGIDSTPLPPRLAGEWGPVSADLDGASTITAAGHVYRVPEFADIKIVTGARGLVVVHVKAGRQVFVLSGGLQLIESPEDSMARAAPAQWAKVNAA